MANIENPERILQYLQENEKATASQLANSLGITTQAVYKHLGRLISNGQVIKAGVHPNIVYCKVNSPHPNPPHKGGGN
ncbi:MAG: winged helix-turn-helix transcriptional regulator, partial [Candidatus Omnitrophica bacterium]|nr:winged helix-turn-helix transcriptional regulator [Candidatus Omnitrophota bacterium]